MAGATAHAGQAAGHVGRRRREAGRQYVRVAAVAAERSIVGRRSARLDRTLQQHLHHAVVLVFVAVMDATLAVAVYVRMRMQAANAVAVAVAPHAATAAADAAADRIACDV